MRWEGLPLKAVVGMSAASDLLDFSKLEDLKELESYTPGFLLQVLQQFQVNFENSLAKTREAM